ncbi:hypothetical protein HK102_007060 [Quaeritorhiza haematococci]|nr:hypothetical protein HK102_007060 [Quaeritorhiza haematococci]
MATFFETVTVSYTQVPISDKNEIDTVKFLEATENLIRLFDILNPTAFAVVKNDMQGNVNKIRTKYNESPSSYPTLQSIVLAEKDAGPKKRVATEGLLWLKRGLEFTAAALRRNIDNATEELSLAMKACPYRKDFYAKLAPADKVTEVLTEWLVGFEKCVAILVKFYEEGGYEKGPF